MAAMPTPGTVHLHIGTMKSGTTFLQRTCDFNRDLLARNGLTWLGFDPVARGVQDLLRTGMQMPGSEGEWRRVARRIREDAQDVLVSHELLARAPLPRIRRLVTSLEPREVRVVLTARQLTKTLPSHWQETVQNRGESRWLDYCDSVCDPEDPRREFWAHHDLVGIIERWSELVPVERMTLVTLPTSSGDPQELWRRFSVAVGLPELTVKSPPPNRSNASIGAASADLMIRVNERTRDLDWPTYRWGFKATLAKTVLAQRVADEPKPVLLDRHRSCLEQRSRTMVEAVERLGVAVVGDLAELIPDGPAGPPPAGADGPTAEPVTDADLLEASVFGLAGLGTRFGQLRQERDDLRKEVKVLRRVLSDAGLAKTAERELAASRPDVTQQETLKARARRRLVELSEQHSALGRARRVYVRARDRLRSP